MESSRVNSFLLALEPQLVWQQFAALTEIPRESGNEAGARNFALHFARSHGFKSSTDSAGNVLLSIPGRGRGRSSQPVMLQGHLDMVCVKNEHAAHNFAIDPIRAKLEKRQINGQLVDVVSACETTLGADNGIGVSLALAAATSPELDDCPPLELLFTVDEEVGLTGAAKVDADFLKAKYLINLDSEDENEIFISCAGAFDLAADLPVVRRAEDKTEKPVSISLAGFPGGHSGVEIHQNRGNAVAYLTAAIDALRRSGRPITVASIDGGSRRNVIPSSAKAVIWLDGASISEFSDSIRNPDLWREVSQGVSNKYQLAITVEPAAAPHRPLDSASQEKVFRMLLETRWGVLAWSKAIDGFVESSNNLASVATDEDRILMTGMARSSVQQFLDTFFAAETARLNKIGAAVHSENQSAPWEPDPGRPLVQRATEIFSRSFGRSTTIKGIHAGLECGVLKAKRADISAFSTGPDIRQAHTTKECVSVPSVKRVWDALVSLLVSLACEPLG